MKKSKIITLAVFVVLSTILFSTCKKEEPKLYGSINGLITEVGTTTALQGVDITLSPTGKTITTGSDGKYEFKELEAKEYTVQASKLGYETNTKTISVTIGEDTKADISLSLDVAKPSIETSNPVAMSYSKATINGNITNLGSGNLSAYGHVWSTSPAPNTSLSTKIDYGARGETGEYTSTLTGLIAETEYYIRAFAVNSEGTSYSNEVSFTTPEPDSTPELVTLELSNITDITAICGGNILTAGTTDIKERGVCWNNEGTPTSIDNKTTNGAGTGEYASMISQLAPSTTYFVRAYAENSVGISYGNELQFSTLASPTAPSLNTSLPTNISLTSVTLGGNVSSNGGASIIQKGVCWGISNNPDINGGNNVASTNGTGPYSVSVTGLNANTIYYARAYASNNVGISYGQEVNFSTTAFQAPSAITNVALNLSQTKATLNGTVNANGNSTTITFEYGTTTTYGTEVNATPSNVTGNSNIDVSFYLTGLTAGETYQYRIKAINEGGVVTGSNISFNTIDASVCQDIEGNIYETEEVGNQIWMIENLASSIYPNGSTIPLVSNNAQWANIEDSNTGDAHCFYNDDSNSDYGALYTWAAAMGDNAISSSANPSEIQGVCPDGWHLPSDAEWTELTNFLGGENVSGGKMKETGTTHWIEPNSGATNESNFSALPSGFRSNNSGIFDYQGRRGYWWSSTQHSNTFAWYRYPSYNNDDIYRNSYNKSYGFAVRCIKN